MKMLKFQEVVLFPGIYRLLLNLYIREMMHLGIHNTDTCNIHASDQIISVLFISIFFWHSLPDQYFSAVVCFLLFNMGDWCGRATAGAIKWVRRKSNYLSPPKTFSFDQFHAQLHIIKNKHYRYACLSLNKQKKYFSHTLVHCRPHFKYQVVILQILYSVELYYSYLLLKQNDYLL